MKHRSLEDQNEKPNKMKWIWVWERFIKQDTKSEHKIDTKTW